MRFDDPLASVDGVMFAVDQLLTTAFANPVLRGRAARQARLRALLSDGSSWERIVTFKESVASREDAARGLRAKLELPNGLPPAPIEEMLLELMRLGGEAARQGKLFVARARQLGQIAEAVRQLRARYGRVPLYHAVEVEPWSRIPERRWALAPCEL
jgi:DNA polymerase-4/protein ImuB